MYNYRYIKYNYIKTYSGKERDNMPNFCYKCGSPLRDGAKFCTGCGSPVRQDVSAVNVSNVQTAPTTIIMPTEPTAAAVSTVTAAAAIKPKRYILLRIVLFLVCGALLFCGWRWGIPNVKKAMLEPSAFSPASSVHSSDAFISSGNRRTGGTGRTCCRKQPCLQC